MSSDTKNRMPPCPTDDQPGFDTRLQDRFITKGHWVIERIGDTTSALPDNEDVVEFGPPQPALGLFSDEELAQVQKNFPYRTR